jgi:hypothetical protein
MTNSDLRDARPRRHGLAENGSPRLLNARPRLTRCRTVSHATARWPTPAGHFVTQHQDARKAIPSGPGVCWVAFWGAFRRRPLCRHGASPRTGYSTQTFPKQSGRLTTPQTFPKHGLCPQTSPNIFLRMLIHNCTIVLAIIGSVLYNP